MSDVNGQIYWAFNAKEDFKTQASPALKWDGAKHALSLQPSAEPLPTSASLALVRDLSDEPPLCVDAYGTFARVNTASNFLVEVGGVTDPVQPLFGTPQKMPVVDLEWLANGTLLVAYRLGSQGGVSWIDPLERFDPVHLAERGFAPTRVCAAGDAIWLVDRSRSEVRFLQGVPAPRVLSRLEHPLEAFRPVPEQANLPRFEDPKIEGLRGDPITDAVALDNGDLVLLRGHIAASPGCKLERLSRTGARAENRISGVGRAHSIASFGANQITLVSPDWAEARQYDVPQIADGITGRILPNTARIPLRHWTGGRLCAGPSRIARYPSDEATRPFRPCAAISHTRFVAGAETGDIVIDSGVEGFVWHRFYIEADLPKGTSITVQSIGQDEDTDASEAWHRHVFGETSQSVLPRGVWLDALSEHPHGKAARNAPIEPDRAGLFTCLVQKEDSKSNSRIIGRYLRMRVSLSGNHAQTPRLYALRVWGPRFSYRDRYLPEFMRIDSGAGAEGSDFMDRYLSIFESVLTPLEGEIAQMWRGANPDSAQSDSLNWLADWPSLKPHSALGEAGKRRMIRRAAALAPWHGTRRGLEGVLDVATDGGVSAGRVVVVEHFRFQRSFATVLGADYDDKFDPLIRGSRQNVNSVLGPGFYLSAADETRVFALFAPALLEHDLTEPAQRASAISTLGRMEFDTGFKVTVLVDPTYETEIQDLIAALVAQHSPAHVQVDIVAAPVSMILGLSSLLGVETRLGTPPPQPAFTLDETTLGQSHLRGTPALDQRI